MSYITSPKTGRQILVDGPTYTKLAKSSKWGPMLHSGTSSRTSSKSRGCSNQGKYRDVPEGMFCGRAGGSCDQTYPVNTPGRARAALSYARHAPNPQGIRNCAHRIARQQGWEDVDGKIKQKRKY